MAEELVRQGAQPVGRRAAARAGALGGGLHRGLQRGEPKGPGAGSSIAGLPLPHAEDAAPDLTGSFRLQPQQHPERGGSGVEGLTGWSGGDRRGVRTNWGLGFPGWVSSLGWANMS